MYSMMEISPRKKKRPVDGDDQTFSPKKLRTAPITPPPSVSRKAKVTTDLPSHLTRLLNLHGSLQHALSHALATCAISPSESGIVRNVLNHVSLRTYSGLGNLSLDDLRQLCWIWEWNAQDLKTQSRHDDSEEDNPFLDASSTAQKDWVRGAMGIVITPATHKVSGVARSHVYGLGVEVELDIDKDMLGGMAAVARWTAVSEARNKEFQKKLNKWAELNSDIETIPHVPLARLPSLPSSKISNPFSPAAPQRRSESPVKSPVKRSTNSFAIPLPITPQSRSASPTKQNSILFPTATSTPDERLTTTPSSTSDSAPSTPRHQRNSSSTPQTPTTARRQALYERVRQRSLSASPTKGSSDLAAGKMTRDQLLKLSQEETRRRCLLGRLGGVAESVWMLFSTPVSSATSSSPMTRKRRALPVVDVAHAVVKSSPVPISVAEANESLEMLTQICPFFLKQIRVGPEDWLEMPAPPTTEGDTPSSPSKRKEDSAEDILTRSPRRIKNEQGGLRTVREIIRRELESVD